MEITSSLISLKEIIDKNYFFNIPIYQRLYVWGDDQIKTLLEDIETAYSDSRDLFYLGGVLVVENEKLNSGRVYDLIDGQQRFTTLWMISIVFNGTLNSFIEREEKEKNRHRVTFAIREDIYQFFKNYISGNKNDNATSHIVNALSLINKFKIQFDLEAPNKSQEIATYILNKVRLIFTEVPPKTDLNKLFEIINNRGIQLQHHEILKALLLNRIEPDDRQRYSYLWDACSYMESYVEKNIRDIAKIRVQDLYENDDAKTGTENLANPEVILQHITTKQNQDFTPLSLSQILSSSESFEINKDNEVEDYEADEVRSIITFPMLLQHTLRIYLARRLEKDIPKILDKELLQIFTKHLLRVERSRQDIKEFFELLWQVRYAFDKHIIKWVRQEDSEVHLICKLEKYDNKGNYYLRRRQPTSNEGVALLQSMLYHSQQITTHYWLTPYFNFLIDSKGKNSFEYLKHLDNHLLCSSEDGSLSARTRKFLEDKNYSSELSTSTLLKSLGTAFPHYWFYKLEFVLWEKFASEKDERWKNFKMTAKNSIEHISPQTQKESDTNTVSSLMLNKFGNLSLVSRSINSEYSNLPFNEKRQRFINNNRVKLDSLKMDLIYSNENWSDRIAEEHQDEIIKIMNEYLHIQELAELE